jgi:PAT family beta-lactamase induction signal transducer AmpG
MQTTTKTRSPWFWVPSLYFAEGVPYVIVMSVSVIMYKKLGISNTEIALYTSWLYLPWVIKPRYSLAFLWLLAFSSATHDIAADGFYMLGLSQHQQAWFVGVRSTFYRLAMIAGQGLLVMLAGFMEETTGNIPLAWTITFYVLSGLFLLFFLYHWAVLPKPEAPEARATVDAGEIFRGFGETFASFFRKEHIGSILAFLLLFRFAEAQLAKMASPFLLDTATTGGLSLSTTQVGFVYGTVGILMLTLGGLLGGFLAARHGLKFWLWWMVAAINLPNAVYIFPSFVQPETYWVINAAVAVEQFGYGFGFTAYMLYMLYVSKGHHETAHFAICTGFMALGMMLPGMFSGWLQEIIGYRNFFLWVMLATIPSFVVAYLIPLRGDFGLRESRDS